MASPWRVRRARSVVLAAIVVVLAGTVASYFYRRRLQPPAPPGPAPIAEDVGQQTQSFSLSKTLGENILYTITAEQVTNFQDTGQALLHNVSVLIYGKDGSRQDRITSPESYYDPAAGSVWIPGEVEMQFDLPAPEGETSGGTNGAGIPLSIYTSQLSFERNTGVASTDAPVRFVFGQGEGTSEGAAYDPEKQILTLQSMVRFHLGSRLPPGDDTLQGKSTGRSGPAEQTLVRAGTVHFIRATGKAVLENSVEITRGPRRIRAARGEIELDNQRRVQRANLAGDVLATEETPVESRQARAERGAVSFDGTGRIRLLELDENVSWSMAAHARGSQRNGRAQHAALSFREPDGLLDRVRAAGDVRMTFRGEAAPTGASDVQTLSGGEAEMTMAPDGKTLREVRIRSGPKLEIVAAASPGDRRTVTGDEFRIGLDDRGEMSDFQAQGSVRVVSEQTGASALRRETSSDALEATFDTASDASGALDRIRQWGRFKYRDAERQAAAEEASYELASETVVLTGNPAIWTAEGRLTAARIELETRTGGMRAEGNVASTFFQRSSGSPAEAEPLHVVADRMRYESAARQSRFEGHARLWQGESFLVEAESLDWSPQAGELTANRKVYSVFRPSPTANTSKPSAGGAGDQRARLEKDTAPLVITADSLRYQRQQRLVHYDGGVRMQRATGVLTAATLEIFLEAGLPGEAAPASNHLSLSAGQIERAVAQRDVQIVDPGRVANGERAEYLPARDEVHLFGAPAKVVDAARGTLEGAELTYFLGDDSIQVQGSPGSPTETRWQVHP